MPLDILIVDDDDMVSRALSRALRGLHAASVRVASTPDEAISTIEEQLPNVMVCDFQLRDTTSASLLRTVRARWPAIRCVLHSASRMDLWTDLLRDKVVDRVVPKPASVQDLLSACVA
jgi:CheY-like chemotaxis protein